MTVNDLAFISLLRKEQLGYEFVTLTYYFADYAVNQLNIESWILNIDGGDVSGRWQRKWSVAV